MGDAWNIPGWTAQQPLPDQPTTPDVTLPDGFVEVTVEAKYVDDQNHALNGSAIRFRPSLRRVQVNDTVIWLNEVVKTVERGKLSVKLMASDIEGFHWKVKECFPGGEEYAVTIPADTTSPVSLFDLPRISS